MNWKGAVEPGAKRDQHCKRGTHAMRQPMPNTIYKYTPVPNTKYKDTQIQNTKIQQCNQATIAKYEIQVL